MADIVISVNSAKAVCEASPHPLTAGMVGLTAEFTFGSEWAGLTKNAVIRGSGTSKTVLSVTGEFTVPYECLENKGGKLEIGVEGRNAAGTIVIPTVYAYIGKIYEGVDDTVGSGGQPTPTQVQQLTNLINARLTDAPSDGEQYCRQNGEWAVVTGGGGGGGTTNYNQLTNKPQINGVTLTGNKSLANIGAAAANHTHSYNDLSDQPTIPEAYDDTALAGRVSTIEGKEAGWDSKAAGNHTHAYSAITGKPNSFTPSAHNHVVSDISDFPSIPTDNIELANGAGYITDAPSDSKQYARKDGAWAEVVAGGGGTTEWREIVNLTVEEEVQLVNHTLTASQKQAVIEAKEMMVVQHIMPPSDETKTSFGSERFSIMGSTYTWFRPYYLHGNTPKYGGSALPSVVYMQQLIANDNNFDGTRGKEVWRSSWGGTNSANWNLTTSQGTQVDAVPTETQQTKAGITKVQFYNSNGYGVGSKLKFYVR